MRSFNALLHIASDTMSLIAELDVDTPPVDISRPARAPRPGGRCSVGGVSDIGCCSNDCAYNDDCCSKDCDTLACNCDVACSSSEACDVVAWSSGDCDVACSNREACDVLDCSNGDCDVARWSWGWCERLDDCKLVAALDSTPPGDDTDELAGGDGLADDAD